MDHSIKSKLTAVGIIGIIGALVAVVIFTLHLSTQVKGIMGNDNGQGAYENLVYESAEHAVQEVLMDESVPVSSDFANVLAEKITTELLASSDPVTMEKIADIVMDMIASGDVKLPEQVTDEIAASVAETILATKDISETDLTNFVATEDFKHQIEDVVTQKLKNVKINLTDADKTALAKQIAPLVTTANENDIKQLIQKTAGSYTYTLTEADKNALASSVASGLNGKIDAMAKDVSSVQSQLKTVQSAVSALQQSAGQGSGGNYDAQIAALQTAVNTLQTASASHVTQSSAEATYAKITEVGEQIDAIIDEKIAEGTISGMTEEQVNAMIDAAKDQIAVIYATKSNLDQATLDAQNALADAVGELDGQDGHDSVPEKIESVRTTLNNQISAIDDRLQDTEEAVNTLESGVQDLQDQITAITGDGGAIDTAIAGVRTDLDSTTTLANQTKTALEAAVDRLNNINGVSGRTMENAFSSLDTSIASINTALNTKVSVTEYNEWKTSVQNQLSALSTDIDDIEAGYVTDEELAAINTRVGTLETTVANIDDTYATDDDVDTKIQTARNAINATIDTLTGRVSTLETNVSQLNTNKVSVSDYNTDKAATDSLLDGLRADLTTVQTALTATQGDVSDASEAITNMTTTINGLSTALNGKVSTNDYNTDKEATDAALETLQNSLTTLTQTVNSNNTAVNQAIEQLQNDLTALENSLKQYTDNAVATAKRTVGETNTWWSGSVSIGAGGLTISNGVAPFTSITNLAADSEIMITYDETNMPSCGVTYTQTDGSFTITPGTGYDPSANAYVIKSIHVSTKTPTS